MWILPPELGPIALPEGVLLLPHHYGAEDRERLLALLGVALPGCRQLVVEGAALEGLIARRLAWAGGLVLVHGLAAETEVDGLRELMAPLGAKHALVQLPQPQVAGTSWMESLLKVPLLRALERAWKNPAHPLRAIGIHECPLREAAQYTDEPVELLAIVTAMVEHRMAHAGVGVGKGDWERSLDQGLAARLRVRLPHRIEHAEYRYLMSAAGSTRPAEEEVGALTARGLGAEEEGVFRANPLTNALERALVRAYVVRPGPDRSGEHTVEKARADELFHMAAELWPIDEYLHFVRLPKSLTRIGQLPSWDNGCLGFAHEILELSDQQRDEVASVFAWIQASRTHASGALLNELIAFDATLRGMTSVGTEGRSEIDSCVATLQRTPGRARWRTQALETLNRLWLLRTCIRRRTASDLYLARERSQDDFYLPRTQGARASVSGLAALRGDLNKRDEGFKTDDSEDSGFPDLLDPSRAWRDITRGEHPRIVQFAAHIGNVVGARLTIADLHGHLVVGVAALAIGDLDAATTRGRTVLDLAARYEIPVLRAFARELLAAVHELRGEYDVAARLLFQSRARYIALEDTSRILGVEQRLTRMGITFDPAGTPRRKRPPRSR